MLAKLWISKKKVQRKIIQLYSKQCILVLVILNNRPGCEKSFIYTTMSFWWRVIIQMDEKEVYFQTFIKLKGISILFDSSRTMSLSIFKLSWTYWRASTLYQNWGLENVWRNHSQNTGGCLGNKWRSERCLKVKREECLQKSPRNHNTIIFNQSSSSNHRSPHPKLSSWTILVIGG